MKRSRSRIAPLVAVLAAAVLGATSLAPDALGARRGRPSRPPARPDRVLYQYALDSLATLQASPKRQARRGEWEQTIALFRRVVDRYPKSGFCDDALLNVGNLYREMAVRFDRPRYKEEAVKAYRWVVEEYPASRLGEAALYAVYEIARDGGDRRRVTEAAKAYVEAYPRGPHARELRDSFKKRSAERAAALPAPPPPDVGEVFSIRAWGGDSSARVVLELEKAVDVAQTEADGGSRLVLTLSRARLHPNLVGKEHRSEGGVLRSARFSTASRNNVELVLEYDTPVEHSVFFLQDPLRLVVDARTPAPPVAEAASTSAPRGLDSAIESAESAPAAIPPPLAAPVEEGDASQNPSGEETVFTTPEQHGGRRRPVNLAAPPAIPDAPSPQPAPSITPPSPSSPPVVEATPVPAPTAPPTSGPSKTRSKDRNADAEPARTRVARAALPKPQPVPPAAPSPSTPPRTNRSGSYSLARQLGLKARRIVIDAGHGGHDPGTIGPGGLQEKDLVLDVALRLERLLRDQLGIDVVMTRDSDVFIELEERTAIANSRRADLFLSIHANSSRSARARGIETYYLNFATTPHAEAVAARENAISTGTMKDLQGLVKTILLNNKIPESRDFAAAVQEALVKNAREVNPATEDRGVHTAPFYVLIGANMPSVLAEIAFVSHRDEEQLLRTSEYRDTIAQSLFQGLGNYLATLPGSGGVLTGGARPTTVPSREVAQRRR